MRMLRVGSVYIVFRICLKPTRVLPRGGRNLKCVNDNVGPQQDACHHGVDVWVLVPFD